MVRNIFISSVEEDTSVADTIFANRENYGLQCWLAPGNSAPCEKYAPSIIDAITTTKTALTGV